MIHDCFQVSSGTNKRHRDSVHCMALYSIIPIESMYGIFAYMFYENHPNVGKYTIHGPFGIQPFGEKKTSY